jgi:hypothetical protein
MKQGVKRRVPQELKPASFLDPSGTAEAMPFQNRFKKYLPRKMRKAALPGSR